MSGAPETVRILILEPKSEDAEILFNSLERFVQISEDSEEVRTVHEAIMALSASSFDLVFISERLSKNHLESFFSDLARVKSESPIRVFFTKDTIWPDEDRAAMAPQGALTSVQRQVNDADWQVLSAHVGRVCHERQVRSRIQEVEQKIDQLMSELDFVARERKRGWKREFNNITSNYVCQLTKFDPTILEAYFNSLTTKAEKQSAPEPLAKALAEVEYRGASARVWEKLRRARLE